MPFGDGLVLSAGPLAGPEVNGMVSIGMIYLLVKIPTGYTIAAEFRLELSGSLTVTVSDGGNGLQPVELSAYGARSAELLQAVARLEKKGNLDVNVRLLALSPPSVAGAAAPTSTATADEPTPLPLPPPPPYLSPLPPGVAVLELELQVPVALWSYNESHVRNWLNKGRRKAAVMVLGAIVPVGKASWAAGAYAGGAAAAGCCGSVAGASSSVAPAGATGPADVSVGRRNHHVEQMVRQAVEDLLEQQPAGGDRDRYSLISCFRELPSVTWLYDQQGGPRLHPPGRLGPPNDDGSGDHQQQEQPNQHATIGGGKDGAGLSAQMSAATHGSASQQGLTAISGGTGILDLPTEVLESVMSQLEPLDLARLRATCTALADAGAAGGAVPGVRLTLFPHQRAAISWMIRREGGVGSSRESSPCCCCCCCYCCRPCGGGSSGGGIISPRHHVNALRDLQRPFQQQHCSHGQPSCHQRQDHRHHNHGSHFLHHSGRHQHHCQSPGCRQQGQPAAGSSGHPMFVELINGGDGFRLWADVGTGELRTSAPPPLPEVRGGFFCDEPGLGKTITALSLVLKTLGQLPTPPPGAAVEWLQNREGRRVGFYTIGGGAAVCAAASSGNTATAALPPAAASPAGTTTSGAAQNGGGGGGGSRRSARLAGPGLPWADIAGASAAASAAAASPSRPPQRQAEQFRLPRKRARVLGAGGSRGAEVKADGRDDDDDEHEEKEEDEEEEGLSPGASTPAASPSVRNQRAVPRATSRGRSQPSSAPPPGPLRSPQPSPPLSPPAQAQRRQGQRYGGGSSPGSPTARGSGGGGARGRGSRGGGVRGREGRISGAAASRKQHRGRAEWKSAGSDGGVEDGDGEDEEEVGDSDGEEEEADGGDSSSHDGDDEDFKPGMKRRRGRCSGGGRRGRGGGGGAGRSRVAATSSAAARRRTLGRSDKEEMKKQEKEKEEELLEVHVDFDAMWVQCEQCQRWRKLPEGAPAPADSDPWFCHMHPLPEAASCAAPKEAYSEDDKFADAPGYLRLGGGGNGGSGGGGSGGGGSGGGGSGDVASNLEYFQGIIRAVADRLGQHPRALAHMETLSWLAEQNPTALRYGGPGVMVPRSMWDESPVYDAVFRELDLVPLADEGGGRGRGSGRRRGGGGAAAGRGVGGGGGIRAVSARHTWHTAPYMRKDLVLDVQALEEALAALRASPSAPSRTYLSAATLVVLPATIIDHWLLQIRTHVARGALRVCVLDRMDPRVTPTPAALAWDYDLVITTFNPLSYGGATRARGKKANGKNGGTCGAWLEALRQVHWLRIILDEGHLLSATTAITNKLQAACGLRAERRWVMTGTPTPATTGSSAAYLQPLLAFLRHEPYGTAAMWQTAVQRPLEACRPEGRRRLMRLLREIMIRACKSDLVLLPRLVRKVTLLDFEPQHAKSYNELVEVVRRNLLTSDWCDDSHSESLLSSRNGRWSRQMMKNVWFSCCVAGSTKSVVKEEDLLETLQLLAGRLGLPAPGAELPGGVAVGPPWLAPGHPMWDVEEALRHGTCCQVCGELVRQPMVTPCGHLACLDCTASDRERCPLPTCRKPYVMQAVDDPARRKHNPNPKWPVPQELIEWQPVYHQQGAEGISGGNWSATWELTRSSKISHMLTRLREVGAAPPPGDRHERQQLHGGPRSPSGAAGAGSTSAPAAPGVDGGRENVVVGGGGGRGEAPPRTTTTTTTPAGSAAAPADATAARASTTTAEAAGGAVVNSGGVEAGAAVGCGGGGGGVLAATAPRRFQVRTKAIIFTQYGIHMQLIESSLMKADIPFAILTQVIGKELREASLSRFQHDPHCGVLLMDQLGAVGLDLSFASYVLLMEPLTDSSLEQQIVSRAHRMGAKKEVQVETLVMRGSAEEALLRLDKKGLILAAPPAPASPPEATAAAPGGGVAPRRVESSTADDPRVAEDHEDSVQVDRRALRNKLFLLMEKVRLGRRGGGAGGGGGAGPSRPAAAIDSIWDGDAGAGSGSGSGDASRSGGSGGIGLGGADSGGGRDGRSGPARLLLPPPAALQRMGQQPLGRRLPPPPPPPQQQQQQQPEGSSSETVLGAEAPTVAGSAAVGAPDSGAGAASLLHYAETAKAPSAVASGAGAATTATTTPMAGVPAAAATAAAAATGAAAAATAVSQGWAGAAAAAAAAGTSGAAPEGGRKREPKRRRVRFAGEDGD